MEKQTIIEAFAERNPRVRFNKLMALFQRYPHHPPALVRYLNVSGYSRENLKSLEYEVKMAFTLSTSDITRAEVIPDTDLPLTFEEMSTYHLRRLAMKKAKEEGVNLPNTHRTTVLNYLNGTLEKEPQEDEKGKEAIPPEKKKLRDEFPFLSDPDCPDKLKILVADKLTAYDNFRKAHAVIQERKDDAPVEELAKLAKMSVENYEENIIIYDELMHYRDHGTILGVHPIFAEDLLQITIDKYSTAEALRRRGSLRSYISRNKRKMETMKSKKQIKNTQAKIDQWEKELSLIKKKLEEKDAEEEKK